MTKTVRKIVFLTFLGLFLLAAPLVVLYTAGYRFNPERLSLVKTGLISVSTNPKSAAIILDGTNTGRESTMILKNVMPGEHTVRLEKADYLTWEKKLEVQENQTTFIQKAVLFLIEEPFLNSTEDFLTFIISEDGTNFISASQTEDWIEIWSRNLSSGEKKILLRLTKNSVDEIKLSWTIDKKLLLVKEIKNGIETDITVDQNGNEQNVKENFLFEWQRDTNQLLFTQPAESGTNLIRRNADGTEQTLATLPTGDYQFLWAPPSLVLLQDKNRNKIILVDDQGVNQPILLDANAFTAFWNPQNDKQLLYASDFELHIFDAEKFTDELLNRVSTPIVAAAWHPTAADVFYADQNNLYALELDHRGGNYQIFPLATMDKIETIAPTTDGQKIYLIGTKNSETGIFEKKLQK